MGTKKKKKKKALKSPTSQQYDEGDIQLVCFVCDKIKSRAPNSRALYPFHCWPHAHHFISDNIFLRTFILTYRFVFEVMQSEK